MLKPGDIAVVKQHGPGSSFLYLFPSSDAVSPLQSLFLERGDRVLVLEVVERNVWPVGMLLIKVIAASGMVGWAALTGPAMFTQCYSFTLARVKEP